MINHLIIDPVNKDLKVSDISVYIEGGSIVDQKVGLSHIVEHLHFDAIHTGQYLLDAYNIQGTFNAYTAIDHVCYYMKIPDENLFKGIQLIMKVIKKYKITQKRLEDEYKIVLQEQSIRNDSPNIWLYEKSFKYTYGGHKLGELALDVPIQKECYYTLKEVKDHCARIYTKQNILVTICSNVSKAKIERFLNKLTLPENTCGQLFMPAPVVIHPIDKFPRFILYSRKFSKTYILISVPLEYNPQMDLNTIITWYMLVYLLGNTSGISEMLNYLRFKKKLVYTIRVGLDTSVYHKMININLSVSKNNVNKSINSIMHVIENVKKGKLQIPFHTHKKNLIKSIKTEIMETNSNVSDMIVEFIRTFGFKDISYEKVIKTYEEVQLHDIVKEANSILKMDSRCTINVTK